MAAEPAAWIRPGRDGCVLTLWVRPGASRAGVTGLHGAALGVRVTAPPARGAANREVLAVVAAALGVRPGDLALEAGAGGRQKRVRVRTLSVEEVRARLAPVLSVDSPPGHN
jgi:uncharacterized protein (TIGR00251 family)